ncbi:PAS domain S-box protein [Undibacterium piscinae]|uniref:PAS domain S-box protein n=1 Tax=Undibacterium piscinae TaxID=2495591 RepID=A0A6M4A8W9_9BURK|nr:PAS domain S-box protein [Undibacterium piscinae]
MSLRLALFIQKIDDIVIKIKAETLLRESERKYANIVQLSPIPLGLIRMQDSCLVELNDSWVTQFGYTREEAVGRTALDEFLVRSARA